MENSKLDLNKTYAAMRSIYRFLEFQNMNAPSILIDVERGILNKYFSELSAEEIIHAINNFNSFRKAENIRTELQNEEMNKKSLQYLPNAN